MMNKIGVCQGVGQIIFTMKIGSSLVSLSKNGRKFNTLLDGRTVMEAKSEKELIRRSIPVIATMTKNLCDKSKEKTVYVAEGKQDSKMIDNLLNNIKDNFENAEIFVLESKPDEMEENTHSEVLASKMTLSDFKKDISFMDETINNSMHLSGILLKTNLPKTMWGRKDIDSVLSEVQSNMEKTSGMQEDLDICFERAHDNIRNFQSMGSGGRIASGKISMAKDIAGRILDNFTTVKTAVSELSQNLNKLYTIDSVFKSATGYPATWFLNSSIFYDFNFEYDNLINHMVKMAKVESDAIEPLLVWRIKVMGDIDVR